MQMNRESPFLAGKIKYWQKPIFDLDKFHKFNEELRAYMSENLQFTFNPFFIQPPRPNSILGSKKETYRFDFVQIEEKKEIFDHIEIGFGEHGYYYDIYINHFELNLKNWDKYSQEIKSLIRELETKIENKFVDLYLKPHNLDKEEKNISISNFSISIEAYHQETGKFQALSSFFNCLNSIKIETEPFFFDEKFHSNLIIPEYSLRIFPENMFKAPLLTQKSGKFLHLERSLKIVPLEISKGLWEIQARGIPFPSMALLIKSLVF